MYDDEAFAEFLRTDPSAQQALKDAAAERRLRARDGLPKHLPATVIAHGPYRWLRIDDDNGTPHIIDVGVIENE